MHGRSGGGGEERGKERGDAQEEWGRRGGGEERGDAWEEWGRRGVGEGVMHGRSGGGEG